VARRGPALRAAVAAGTIRPSCRASVRPVATSSSCCARRLGAALIEHLGAIALAEGRPALTLTTFRDVPWNAPYYERLGFAVVEPAEQGPELAALVAHEAATIPGEAPRVAMRRPLSTARRRS
jgi:hypothetical protein